MDEAIRTMAETVGISPENMRMFLDLYAIEVKAGATLEEAIDRVHRLIMNLAEQAGTPEPQQAAWFRALKDRIATDVWNIVRGKEATA